MVGPEVQKEQDWGFKLNIYELNNTKHFDDLFVGHFEV